VQVNGSPDLLDFVDSVDVVKTGIDLPAANVKVRGGGGGGAGSAAGGVVAACPPGVAGLADAGTSTPEGGPASEGASGVGGVLPPAGDCKAAACSGVFALFCRLALSRADSEPGLDAALDEFEEFCEFVEQLS